MVRYKHRYIVVEIQIDGKPIHAPLKLKPYVLYEAVIEKVQQLHGDYGVALIKPGFMTKYCNEMTRIALMKTRHEPYRILASSLPFVNTLEGKSIALNTIYTGATMRQCFKFIQQHQRKHLNQAWSKLRTDDERKAFELAVMDLTMADPNNVSNT
ncbi:POP5 ribonuclease P/MRP subunit [Arctopsyche grandis]|uniref:POP5 ribonuclease P/MRP subunit n=1 Tax=Arctopsyche grandis TaxID=121162 RepID=UPI00406D7E18